MKITFQNIIDKAQPDPFMCRIPGGWAMYVTGAEGVGAYFCDTPFGPWEYKGIVCKMDDRIEYWAPCMYRDEDGFYLYFSCRRTRDADTQELLHVAKADSPFGPFGNAKRLCEKFSIDPHVVSTEDGLFLWYCMDRTDTERVGTRIFVQKMRDPVTLEGDPVEVVQPSFDEEIYMRDRFEPGKHWHTIEGPFWLQVDGWQYVMYSGACYQNGTYHIGYAAAKSTAPDLRTVSFEKHTDNGQFTPLMTKNKEEEGVGHHSVICCDGQYYAVYHARDYFPDPWLSADQRTARICKLHFHNGVITAERMTRKGWFFSNRL